MARHGRRTQRHSSPPHLKAWPKAAKAGCAPGALVYVGKDVAAPSFATLIEYGPEQDNYLETRFASPAEGQAYNPHYAVFWLNLHGLGNIDFLRIIGERFDLHPLTLEDILHTEQRPKIEVYPGYAYITMRLMSLNAEGGLSSEQISIVLGKRFALTFQEKPTGTFDAIRESLKSSQSRIRALGPDYLVYALLDKLVDRYFLVLETIGEQVETLADSIAAAPESAHFLRLQEYRRDLQTLKRGLWPLREVVGNLLRNEHGLFDTETLLYVRDVYDHLFQLIESVEALREIVGQSQEVYLSLQNQHMNGQMRMLTALTAIFMPMTLIAGIYGMNFDHIPELHWNWGYYWALGAMALIGAAMGIVFWRRKWF